MINQKCKICKSPVKGRSDKIFCSIDCKNEYHVKLRRATSKATQKIDRMLHRNRSILLEIMGKRKTQIKIPRDLLDKKKFNYSFLTQFHVNNQGKTVYYIYDFSWMIFSDQEILIKRIRKN